MSIQVLDNFGRADAATLGANWTNSGAGAGYIVLGGTAVSLSSANGSAVYSAWNSGNDHYAEGRIIQKGSGSDAGAFTRLSQSAGNSTGYIFEINDTDSASALGSSMSCGLYKVVANVFTVLGSSITLTINPGDVIRSEVIGTAVTAKLNGAIVVGPITDAAIASGKPGLGLGAAGSPAVLGASNVFSYFAAGNFYETPRIRAPLGWPTGNGPFSPRRINRRRLSYQPRSYTISGRTIDSVGNIVPGATVKLYTSVDDIERASTVSDAGGNYSFLVSTAANFYCVAYLAGSPDRSGTTVNTVIAA